MGTEKWESIMHCCQDTWCTWRCSCGFLSQCFNSFMKLNLPCWTYLLSYQSHTPGIKIQSALGSCLSCERKLILITSVFWICFDFCLRNEASCFAVPWKESVLSQFVSSTSKITNIFYIILDNLYSLSIKVIFFTKIFINSYLIYEPYSNIIDCFSF